MENQSKLARSLLYMYTSLIRLLPSECFGKEKGTVIAHTDTSRTMGSDSPGGSLGIGEEVDILGGSLGIGEEVMNRACALANKVHNSHNNDDYGVEDNRESAEILIAFPGSWSVNDWFAKNEKAFGETKVNLELFPSLTSIGMEEAALVNEAFQHRFESILANHAASLQHTVQKAVEAGKQVIFTGHSSGAPMAILATLWFLEQYKRNNTHSMNRFPFLCVTFGSPLVGNHIFSRALTRENWTKFFVHFVNRSDIVPLIFLAPLSSIEKSLEETLLYLNPKTRHQSIGTPTEDFYLEVMSNAATVANHAACNTMGNSSMLLDTVANLMDLSPYRPFGINIFCTENGKLLVVSNSNAGDPRIRSNSNAVLQLLFYTSQLRDDSESESESERVAHLSLQQHLVYESGLRESLRMQRVVYLNESNLEQLPLYSNVSDGTDVALHVVLNDLALSTNARLCLRAAGQLENRKEKNLLEIKAKKEKLNEYMVSLGNYKTKNQFDLGYYDAFKLHKKDDDFNANVSRLQLAGLWDEIIEMLIRYDELPDEFEGMEEWVTLGTTFRQLVEPLDIANYYRHVKGIDSKQYMMKGGRPKRYRYTQKWREYAERMAPGTSLESCFWAKVEELGNKPYEDVKESVDQLEKQVWEWIRKGELPEYVFLKGTTFTKWWNTLPEKHRSNSCIARCFK